VPEDREPLAPVDPARLGACLSNALQDIQLPTGVVDRPELIFLDAWIRAYLAGYAPGLDAVEVKAAGDALVVGLTDGGQPLEVSFRPGRPPDTGPSEYDFITIPPCDMVAILAPVWTPQYAPLSLASIVSFMHQAGIAVTPVDLNIWTYRALRRMGRSDLAVMWHSQVNFTLWADENDWADEMMALFGHVMDRLVRNIVASGARTVGFTTYSSNVAFTIRLARLVKEADPSITVLAGGSSATAVGRFVQRNGYHGRPLERLSAYDPWRVAPEWYHQLLHDPAIDHLAVGEAELTLPRVQEVLARGGDLMGTPGLATLRDGAFTFTTEELVFDLDSIPYPTWDRLEPSRYDRPDHLPFWFSRGCINRCAYCTNNAYFEHAFRARSPRHALDEMVQMIERYGVKTFGFTDLCCNGNMEALDRFLDLKIAEGVDATWHSYVVMRGDMKRELVEKMVRSGNIRFEYGFESGCDEVLKSMGKSYDHGVASDCLKWSTEAGGFPCVNLVVGFPHETREHLETTIEFIRENAPSIGMIASMNAFYMMPHSRVLEQAEKLELGVGWDYGDWSLLDGSNDATERIARVIRLCEAIEEIGVEHGSPYELTITDEAPEVSTSRRTLQSGHHKERGTIRRGPLRVTVEEGRMRLAFAGEELTTGLHFYTAAMVDDDSPFQDSSRASWRVEVSGHRLRAAGLWPDKRFLQLWWFTLTSESTVRVVVETHVRVPLTMPRRQTHLMLRGEYTHYRAGRSAGGYEYGEFGTTFPAEGEPWQRLYFEGATPVLEALPAGDLPGVRVTCEDDLRWDYRSGLIITDVGYSARVLQHLLVDDQRVDQVDFYAYKGTIEILPRGQEKKYD